MQATAYTLDEENTLATANAITDVERVLEDSAFNAKELRVCTSSTAVEAAQEGLSRYHPTSRCAVWRAPHRARVRPGRCRCYPDNGESVTTAVTQHARYAPTCSCSCSDVPRSVHLPN